MLTASFTVCPSVPFAVPDVVVLWWLALLTRAFQSEGLGVSVDGSVVGTELKIAPYLLNASLVEMVSLFICVETRIPLSC